MKRTYIKPISTISPFNFSKETCLNIPVSGKVDDPSYGEAKELDDELDEFERMIIENEANDKKTLWE